MTAIATPATAIGEVGKVWATAISTRPSDGWRIVHRYVREFVASFDRSTCPDRVTLIWRYRSTTGMPDEEVREAMDRLEDLLQPHVSEMATLAIVSTGNEKRLWTYYTRSESEFIDRLNLALREHDRFPIEIDAAREPDWETYRGFVAGVRE